MAANERTLSIIKPDATRRNLTGKINAKFEEQGLRIVAQKRLQLTADQADKYDEKGKFISWAVRIARNLAIDEYRKDRRGPKMLRENEEYDIFNTVGGTEESVEDKIIHEENAQYVQDLIKQIPEKQREVLIMRHYANMSFKEIADVQGVNINTALGRM